MARGQNLGECHAFMEGDRGERTKHPDQRRPQQQPAIVPMVTSRGVRIVVLDS
jgi:hypothetical protein